MFTDNKISKSNIETAYANFVHDVGGFLWQYKESTGHTFTHMAALAHLTTNTISRLANRKTKNPQGYTLWELLKVLDDRQIIKHSMLEGCRKFNKATIKKLSKIIK